MQNKNDIGRAFEDLKNYIYQRHEGVLLERQNGGWHVPSLKKWFPSWDLATLAIDHVFDKWNENILKQNPKMNRVRTILWAAKEFLFEFVVIICLFFLGIHNFFVRRFGKKKTLEEIISEDYEYEMYHKTSNK